MANNGYIWRSLTTEQQEQLLALRKDKRRPWHSPPHRAGFFGLGTYHIAAACYEHAPHIGFSPERMDEFSEALVKALNESAEKIFAWSVLPNHYHALVKAPDLKPLLSELGSLHGRTSHQWNGEENTRGRKVFHRAADREMRSESHYWATLNYVHHNPVHHGYVEKWQDWRWGSAVEYLETETPAEVKRLWESYPLGDYGKGWDEKEM